MPVFFELAYYLILHFVILIVMITIKEKFP